jgi:hypothetical protein
MGKITDESTCSAITLKKKPSIVESVLKRLDVSSSVFMPRQQQQMAREIELKRQIDVLNEQAKNHQKCKCSSKFSFGMPDLLRGFFRASHNTMWAFILFEMYNYVLLRSIWKRIRSYSF